MVRSLYCFLLDRCCHCLNRSDYLCVLGLLHFFECLNCSTGDIEFVFAAGKDLRSSICDPRQGKYGTHSTSCDNTAPGSRHDADDRAGVLCLYVMRDGRLVGECDLDRALLRAADRFLYSRSGVARLAGADAYRSLAITNNNRNRKAETASSGNHTGHATDIDRLVIKLRAHTVRHSFAHGALASTTISAGSSTRRTATIPCARTEIGASGILGRLCHSSDRHRRCRCFFWDNSCWFGRHTDVLKY